MMIPVLTVSLGDVAGGLKMLTLKASTQINAIITHAAVT
jgi:hypothetical protein